MLYSCRSINIEYKWLCLGICIYTGKVRGRLSLVSQPAKVIEKLEWGRTVWEHGRIDPLSQA